jgi:hypothetical protein
MAILSDHETMTQFILGLVVISLIFSGYLLFRIRRIGADVECLHEGFHELILDSEEKANIIDELDLADYVLEFADHLGIPTYKMPKEDENNSSEIKDWDSGTNN